MCDATSPVELDTPDDYRRKLRQQAVRSAWLFSAGCSERPRRHGYWQAHNLLAVSPIPLFSANLQFASWLFSAARSAFLSRRLASWLFSAATFTFSRSSVHFMRSPSHHPPLPVPPTMAQATPSQHSVAVAPIPMVDLQEVGSEIYCLGRSAWALAA